MTDIPAGWVLESQNVPVPEGFSYEQPTRSGVAANLAAGANEFLASAGGLPVDVATHVINQLRGLSNQFNTKHSQAFGQSAPVALEPITNPIGGVDSLKSALGVIGADPRAVVPTTSNEALARGVGAAVPAAVAPYLGARAAIEAGVTAPWARMLGGATGPGQSGVQTAAGAISNAAVGASGELGGNVASQFVPEGSPYHDTAKLAGNIAGGALMGGVLSAISKGGGGIASPPNLPQIKVLQGIGVTPTPGQILGGSVGRAEEGAMSLPFAGDAIRNARQRATEQLNRGIINNALEPIGESISPSTNLGREAINEAWDKVTAAYNSAVPNAGARLTPQAITELQKVYSIARGGLPKEFGDVYENNLKRIVTDRISNNGYMSGEAFKEAESDLGKYASKLLNNPNSTAWDRDLGDAYRETQAILRRSLEAANPESADQIRSANAAFSRMLRVGDASMRPGADPGVFTPAQFQQSVKKYANQRQYQRGNAPMQDIADAGRTVLGQRVPDSGTPYRSLIAMLGMGMADPTMLLKLGIGTGAIGGLYSSPGQRVLASMLTRRPTQPGPISDFVAGLSPPIAAPASSPLMRMLLP
jgi:hypothetical protein